MTADHVFTGRSCGYRLPWLLAVVALSCAPGCYAPLHSPGVDARILPDTFRMPIRTSIPPLNLATLSQVPPVEYVLGPDDALDVTVYGLNPGMEIRPVRANVMADGSIQLPTIGSVLVGGKTLNQAQAAVAHAYADGFIKDARVNLALAERSTVDVMVLGHVLRPGKYQLPKYENDVAHAIAAAGGLTEEAKDEIEVHRRVLPRGPMLEEIHGVAADAMLPAPPMEGAPVEGAEGTTGAEGMTGVDGMASVNGINAVHDINGFPIAAGGCYDPGIIRIPLRGGIEEVRPEDVVLHSGEVVMVPRRVDQVFFVVGRLNPINFVKFALSVRERELGTAYILPPNREIDVTMAVAMAGYVDPIDSPSRVTVQRVQPDGSRLLILVDLMRARRDPKENVMIAHGDIIYLNPDAFWWTRLTFNKIFSSFFNVGVRFTSPL